VTRPEGSHAALRTLIVDDEPHARRLLRALLEDVGGVDIVAEAEDGAAALSVLQQGGVDLVLLDVQMPELSAFDVIERVGPDNMPATIFVTAYEEHAVRAFDVNAVDYILKPFDRRRLMRALKRALERGADSRDTALADQLRAVLTQVRARTSYPDRIVVRSGQEYELVDLREVGWIEADDKTLRIHAVGRVHTTRGSMRALEQQLDPHRFPRVHRSIIVNAAHVRRVEPWFQGDFVLHLRDGTKVTSGRSYRTKVVELLKRAVSPDASNRVK
jgi:two-component system LytT family response regulator